MMTSLPKSKNGYEQILLCVDDFTSYIQCIPVKNATADTIIECLKTHIFQPFGIPKNIRCDEQSTWYNSTTFYQFMKNYKISMSPTSVGSPYSNARAESSIKNIKNLAKKFLYQEHCLDKWDEFLPILVQTHNTSTGIYGYSS